MNFLEKIPETVTWAKKEKKRKERSRKPYIFYLSENTQKVVSQNTTQFWIIPASAQQFLDQGWVFWNIFQPIREAVNKDIVQ